MIDLPSMTSRLLWRWRSTLWSRVSFGGQSYRQSGRKWWDWHQLPKDAGASEIAFAFVATHNHFVLDRGGKVFNQTAPLIKLPTEAGENDLLAFSGS